MELGKLIPRLDCLYACGGSFIKKNSCKEVRQLIASSNVWDIHYNICSVLENLDLERNYANQKYPSTKNPP